jgi:hypothetical protein
MLEAKANTGSGLDKLATDLVAGEHIPLNKLVTGALGTNSGPVTPTNSLPVGIHYDGGVPVSTGAPLPVAIGIGGALVGSSNLFPVGLYTAGSPVTALNPYPVGLSLGGGVTSPSNPLSVALSNNAANATALNPIPSQLSVGNVVVSDTNPLPTKRPNRSILTTSALSTLDTSILNSAVGAAGWVDTLGATELICQTVTTVGITAGSVIFESTNDPTSNTGIPIPYDDIAVAASKNLIGQTAIPASTTKMYRAALNARFVRVRISTAFVGGTVSGFSYFKEAPYTPSTTTLLNQAVSVSGNVNATPLSAVGNVLDSSLTRTVTGTGSTGTNSTGRGIMVLTNVTAIAGTSPTLVLTLQVQDTVSLAWVNVPGVTFAARTAIGLAATVIYPGATVGPEVFSMSVPRVYRLAWTIGGTTPSFTFSTSVLPLL